MKTVVEGEGEGVDWDQIDRELEDHFFLLQVLVVYKLGMFQVTSNRLSS